MITVSHHPWLLPLAQRVIARGTGPGGGQAVPPRLWLAALHTRTCGSSALYDMALEAGGVGCA